MPHQPLTSSPFSAGCHPDTDSQDRKGLLAPRPEPDYGRRNKTGKCRARPAKGVRAHSDTRVRLMFWPPTVHPPFPTAGGDTPDGRVCSPPGRSPTTDAGTRPVSAARALPKVCARILTLSITSTRWHALPFLAVSDPPHPNSPCCPQFSSVMQPGGRRGGPSRGRSVAPLRAQGRSVWTPRPDQHL
jgi:hypothetical protein